MASRDPLRELCEEATCPICLHFFQEPVILAQCGHTFCRPCLTQWASISSACPRCKKKPGSQPPKGHFSPNWPLASIVGIAQRLQEEEAQRREAEQAQRGRCSQHQAPLHLFCREDQTSLCWVCSKAKEHEFHQVVQLEEVQGHYQGELQVQLKCLKEKREHLLKQIEDEKLGRQACLVLLQEEKKKIKSPFDQIHTFLKEKLKTSLTNLRDLEKETEEKYKARVATLSEESSHLTDLITEVETKCQQLPSEFLQDIGSTLNRCKRKPVGYMVHLPLQMQERIRIYSQKTSALETVMNNCKESLESIGTEPTKVSVTLDKDTAYPSLILSSNLKSVIVGSTQDLLPDNPERFEFMHCVLGCEAFNSGSYWWEVEVTMQQEKKGNVGCRSC
ncbi:zinc finger protein RFP-like [Sceloporus undulatus]|uniref:zinc finger protein RFP-like n=1 Tax=Sceloporus undulatus TaxID=8520 RepID=UPI001C4BC0EA|nr:zinc finger protein RFP-like [Sceloporus undulatus]